ncbi:hypothetical protein [Sedimentitalea nanhaiensis]|uniref:Uncharacterized protein n=1 Tax=Sedimentitalea nanhaiensis TaxID=999627 RepID=A0A1I7AKY4_9RHOB|nr:hypothetical protein [Sedimentitalea nanhaiensis]SFT75597.1 hypothetical protein SAMN05216236_10730 [Sedimentitalea nanhaiensis]
MKGDALIDPKGLIHEAYRIDGITASECRSIFLDWALSLPEGQETGKALRVLLERYGEPKPDHPMTTVMRDGLASVATPQRRGGWRARPRN